MHCSGFSKSRSSTSRSSTTAAWWASARARTSCEPGERNSLANALSRDGDPEVVSAERGQRVLHRVDPETGHGDAVGPAEGEAEGGAGDGGGAGPKKSLIGWAAPSATPSGARPHAASIVLSSE